MTKLTEQQERTVMQYVESQNLSIRELKDDLIDHLCCVVEERLSQGIGFDVALKGAVEDLAPNGLHRIEVETVLLINSAKIIFMNKFIYLIGLINAMMMSVAYVMSMLHWTGARLLSIIGSLGFAFLFLPMLFASEYKKTTGKPISNQLRFYFGFASAELLGLSLAMKQGHLQGADMLLLLGGVVFTFMFLPFLFFTLYKKSLESA